MRMDVEKILDLEYINSLIFGFSNEIDSLKSKFVSSYEFDTIIGMSKEDIVALFDKYGLSSLNILAYIDSDFIDSNWEFADLFQEDILHASELKEEKKLRAIDELNKLNNKISLDNTGHQKEIDMIQVDLDRVVYLKDILEKDGVLSEQEIEELKAYLFTVLADNREVYLASYMITQYLIEKSSTIVKEEEVEDTAEFEKTLDEVYSKIQYEDDMDDLVTEPTYPETTLIYYDFYKDLFKECGLGDNLQNVLEVAHDISQGLNKSANSISKIDFCIELAFLLYSLNEEYKHEKINQEKVTNVLVDLGILDRRYDEDLSLRDFKDNLLEKINRDFSVLSLACTNASVMQKQSYRLNLLKQELLDNFINNNRKEELLKEYASIKEDMEKIMFIVRQKDKLIRIKDKIIKLLSVNRNSNLGESYYLGLTSLQGEVLNLIESFDERAYVEDISLDIAKIANELSKYDSSDEKKVVDLQGFVLFDVNEENETHVVTDLDIKNKDNFIDESMDKTKLASSLNQYNGLIDDLLSYGEPGIIKKNMSSSGTDKIVANVYLDPRSKKNPTKMVVIRPHTTSVVRFLSQRFVINPGTKVFGQVMNILQELLPGISINNTEPFAIYLNFVSSIQRNTEEVYHVGISRYNKQSNLYNLLTHMSSKEELTEEECEMLKDYIKLTLNAYSELENKNENLSFDIINQIGGKKSRG